MGTGKISTSSFEHERTRMHELAAAQETALPPNVVICPCWSAPANPPTTGITFLFNKASIVFETRILVVSITGRASPKLESVTIPTSLPVRGIDLLPKSNRA